MNRSTRSWVGLFCFLLVTHVAIAGAPRPTLWAGIFDLRDVDVGDDEVTLTIVLRVVNPTSTAVTEGELFVLDPLVPGQILGRISGVSLEPGVPVRIEERLELPRREYDHWMRGGAPRAYIKFAGVQQRIVLRRDLEGREDER